MGCSIVKFLVNSPVTLCMHLCFINFFITLATQETKKPFNCFSFIFFYIIFISERFLFHCSYCDRQQDCQKVWKQVAEISKYKAVSARRAASTEPTQKPQAPLGRFGGMLRKFLYLNVLECYFLSKITENSGCRLSVNV